MATSEGFLVSIDAVPRVALRGARRDRAAFAGIVATAMVSTLSAEGARAEEPSLPASMTCARVTAPGRVPCSVDARVDAGDAITWGDVVLVATPPFLTALRGRIGPHDATLRDAGEWRWALALVARGPGRGRVEGRVRLVVCRGGSCAPRELPVSVDVEVEGAGDVSPPPAR